MTPQAGKTAEPPAANARKTPNRHGTTVPPQSRRCPTCGHGRFTAALAETYERVYILDKQEEGFALVLDEEIFLGRAARLVCIRCGAPLPVPEDGEV